MILFQKLMIKGVLENVLKDLQKAENELFDTNVMRFSSSVV